LLARNGHASRFPPHLCLILRPHCHHPVTSEELSSSGETLVCRASDIISFSRRFPWLGGRLKGGSVSPPMMTLPLSFLSADGHEATRNRLGASAGGRRRRRINSNGAAAVTHPNPALAERIPPLRGRSLAGGGEPLSRALAPPAFFSHCSMKSPRRNPVRAGRRATRKCVSGFALVLFPLAFALALQQRT
jgi:hypothetical protein